MQRPEHRRRRADRGDDHLGLVPQQHRRSCSSRALERCTIRLAQTAPRFAAASECAATGFDLAEPFVELFGAAAIHRRERADHAVAAGGYHELDAGDQKHRRRDQRQAEAVAKAREEIDCWQFIRLEQTFSLC
jgi:hypothetical protein